MSQHPDLWNKDQGNEVRRKSAWISFSQNKLYGSKEGALARILKGYSKGYLARIHEYVRQQRGVAFLEVMRHQWFFSLLEMFSECIIMNAF